VTPARRRLLAAAGTTLLSGCTGLPRLGGRERPSPSPFLREPRDWAAPDHDAANTNATPSTLDRRGDSPTWTARDTASQVDGVTRPVVADGVVYVVLAGVDRGTEFERLLALDARTGRERWRRTVEGAAFGYPPTVAGETVLWLAGADTTLALDAAAGGVRWRYDGTNHDPPVAAHGLVLVGGGRPRRPALVALDPRDGREVWRRREDERNWALLAADDERLYATLHADTDAQSSAVHALDPGDGATRWRTDAVAPRRAAVGPAHLFVSTARGDERTLHAVETATGDVGWRDTRTLPDDGPHERQSVAAVTTDRLLVLRRRADEANVVECRAAATGTLAWRGAGSPDGPGRLGRPVVAGDRVHAVQADPDASDASARLRSWTLDDGSSASRPLDPPVGDEAVVADGGLFAAAVVSSESVAVTRR
jgi:outer membrane protein assembly factor BamB